MRELISKALRYMTPQDWKKVEVVRRLIESGKCMQVNKNECTPLHSAAMAINPNVEIAKLLLESRNGRRHLNRPNVKALGHNTALHIAAANVNVTEVFIQQFKEANPRIVNSTNDTPFHVAAKSHNPDTIIYMLDTFVPTNAAWDIDLVDKLPPNESKNESRHPRNRLINICARSGNTKAVVLLIKHGADTSKDVLHEIVRDSVISPEKIDKLVEVYQTIIDNAVTWRCLEEHTDFLKNPGSDKCMELSRKMKIWLLTNPLEDYGNMDVLQFALVNGASQMFWKIINTESVFRAKSKEICKRVGKCYKKKKTWIAYDVTNFTNVTTPPDRVSTDAQATPSETEGGTETNRAGSTTMTKNDNNDDSDSDDDELTSLAGRQNDTADAPTESNNARNKCRPQRNFDKPSPPKMP